MKQPILGAYAVPAEPAVPIVWRSLPMPSPRGPVEALAAEATELPFREGGLPKMDLIHQHSVAPRPWPREEQVTQAVERLRGLRLARVRYKGCG